MQNYLVTLKYYDRIYLPYKDFDSEIVLLNAVLNAIGNGSVEMLGYAQADMFDFNFPKGLALTEVIGTETIIEVLLPIDEDAIDWHDGGESLYNYMANALSLQEVNQVYAVIKQNWELVLTRIGYRVQE